MGSPATTDWYASVLEALDEFIIVKVYPGTGVGLAICRRIIARHGGSIGLGPKEGEESLFWFSLPIAKVAASGARGLW